MCENCDDFCIFENYESFSFFPNSTDFKNICFFVSSIKVNKNRYFLIKKKSF